MELIKNLDGRNSNGCSLYSWGLFYCPYCKKEVVKQLGNGKNCKSCGCSKHIVLNVLSGG